MGDDVVTITNSAEYDVNWLKTENLQTSMSIFFKLCPSTTTMHWLLGEALMHYLTCVKTNWIMMDTGHSLTKIDWSLNKLKSVQAVKHFDHCVFLSFRPSPINGWMVCPVSSTEQAPQWSHDAHIAQYLTLHRLWDIERERLRAERWIDSWWDVTEWHSPGSRHGVTSTLS